MESWMTAFDRIHEMLRLSRDAARVFPATVLYNEGWLLRLVLDWFSCQPTPTHALAFAKGARWFSEALLPTQFFARRRGDELAEGWTHADAVIGHVSIGGSAVADTRLAAGATQFLVTEAKLYSPLSSGVTNAPYFDQAARNVACMAELLQRAGRPPDQMSSLGFFVLAPAKQITGSVFATEMSPQSLRDKVTRRVSEYADPSKHQWLSEWFLPTLTKARIECLSWEGILEYVKSVDSGSGSELSDFYVRCLEFNRVVKADQP